MANQTLDAPPSSETKTKLPLLSQPEEPAFVIEAQKGWSSLELGELWHYRELLFFLFWRDVKVRYRQTALGIAWAVLQPLLTMVIFSVIFGSLAKLPAEGFPYPIFTYTALLPWQLFSFALTNSSNSLIGNTNLITKIYFPRLAIPVSSVLVGLVDFFFSFIILLGMMVYYGIPITLRILTLPFMLIIALASALGVGLWLSALNVKYRDVRYTVPFLTQFWQYATPVAYSSTLISAKLGSWSWVYGLNPMAGVVEGFRWALLGKSGNIGPMFLVSIVIIIGLLVGGLIYFKRMEAEFADVI
jgi:lipopolysaccharide transport system permease protein